MRAYTHTSAVAPRKLPHINVNHELHSYMLIPATRQCLVILTGTVLLIYDACIEEAFGGNDAVLIKQPKG